VAAVGDSVAVEEWAELFEAGFAYIAGRFARVEPRRQARAFLHGLLSDVDTRSCWQLAEQAADPTPHRMQRLLGEAVWDADAVRDDLRRYVVAELGAPGSVLIADDTGDLKSGVRTVGVQRQYTGTAGRIENAQVAVFLAYASRHGYTLIDREVYLPRCWTDDPARCAAAGVPEQVRFATKITLARRMLTRAADAGVPASWCTADEFYGGDRGLRRDLQARGMGYVLAVARSHRLITCAAIGPQRADQIAAALSARAWNRYSAGDGAKGLREYEWAWVSITHPSTSSPATIGCWSAVAWPTASWPSTAAGHRGRWACPPSCGWPAPAGAWRPASRPARTPPGWTNTRSAAGTPGTGTPPWSCSPTPS
jgi:SRSO17 transposase